jgi:ketosteroid isomerase-like protein
VGSEAATTPPSAAALLAQEAVFGEAFAAGDVGRARHLYDPEVIYRSPTVRLFGWPRRIDGVERALEFIALTIQGCEAITYRALEHAIVAGSDTAYVRVAFDWTAGGRRLRSVYLVRYRYRDGRIVEQDLYYDPSDAPDELS